MKAKKTYQQKGIFITSAMIIGILFMGYIILFIEQEKEIDKYILGLSAILMLIPIALFYRMTIIVEDHKISLIMGVGFLKKTYYTKNIKAVTPVKNSIFYGIGIRKIPRGWLYNVQGNKAVELSFKNSKGIIRLGTNSPDELSKDIEQRISHEEDHHNFRI